MRRPALFIGLLAVFPVACNKSAPPAAAPAKTATLAVAVDQQSAYDLGKLAADMKAASAEKRARAIQAAADLDQKGEDVVPVLLDALKDPTAGKLGGSSDRPNSTRETAVLALLELKGGKGKKALLDTGLKTLEQGLRDGKPNVREHTVNAIGLIGPDAKATAPAITRLCTDGQKEVRGAAYRSLQKIKNVPPGPIVRLLVHPNPEIAGEAAAALSWLKPTGPDTVQPLLDALKRQPREKDEPDDIAYIRNAAAEALANVGAGAETAVPTLVDMLTKTRMEDIERMVRPMKPTDTATNLSGPVLALRRIGKPAVPAVVPLLKHEEPTVRYLAATVLAGMPVADAGEALPDVQAAMEAERGLPTGQMFVFEELAACALNLGGDQEKITTLVIDLLKSDEEVVRFRAAKLLARTGRQAAPAVARLTEMLNDPVGPVQMAAVEALAAIGPAAKDAVIELAGKLDSEDENMQMAAARALHGLGPAAAPAVPALAKALDANYQSVVIEAANALAAVGPEAVGAVEALAKHLEDANSRREERLALLEATSAIGPPARGAIPAVAKLLVEKNTDLPVRTAAAETLGRIGSGKSEAIKPLTEVLKDIRNTPPAVQAAVLRSLGRMGPEAKSVGADIKAHQNATRDASGKVWASAALAALGTEADANTKAVLAALKDKTPAARTARIAAIEAAELLGPRAKPGVPDLVEALKDRSAVGRAEGGSVCERAARTLGRLGPTAKEAIRPLADLLRDPDKATRRAAAEALGAMGPDAVIAVPKLRELARSDRELAAVANAALDRIEPRAME